MSLPALRLQQLIFFQQLSPATLKHVESVARQRRFVSGESILLEGETAAAVFFVLEGEVRIYRLSPDGREQVLANVTPGKSFNTVPPLLADGRHTASARAVTDVVLLAIGSQDYLVLLREHPDLSFALLKDFAARLAHLTNLVENLALHSVRGRMAQFLLDQADGLLLPRRWTQDEMAEHIGAARDVVGRTLRDFITAGYIRREGHRIILSDRPGLEHEAQF